MPAAKRVRPLGASDQQMDKTKTKTPCGTDEIGDRLAAALAKCGYEVVKTDVPLRVHSHCAGMDAVAFSIKKLGLHAKVLVTECAPQCALFHMMHHSSKIIEHIIMDIKCVAEGRQGPCFMHNGKMCTWGDDCDLLFSGFVCKPYSTQSNKRIKTMAVDVGSDPCGVDTYFHTRTIIAKYQPRAFVLENVKGVDFKTLEGEPDAASKRKTTKISPADFMLGELQEAGYEVKMVQVTATEVANMCQSRPRMLFFGVKHGESVNLDSVLRLFKRLGKEYSALRKTDKIDDFLDAGAWGSDDPGAGDNEEAEAEAEYTTEFSQNLAKLEAVPKDLGAGRPSDSVPAETAKVRAKIDALAHFHPMHVEGCAETSGCGCHPLADISQCVERAQWHVDGSIPTLTTRTRLFSYKFRRFIAPSELAASMGYRPRCSLAPFSPTGAATLVGNGYCVPVCALALAAAASVVGSVGPKTKTGPSATPRPSKV